MEQTKQQLKPIKALLLDDEQEACRNLQSLLQQNWSKTISVSGIALDTEVAERMIQQDAPEVVFVDIEMPGENAFQFLDRISPFSFEIIFVTAYDEYALRALKLNAIDYILKPISLDELGIAIKKLEEKLYYKNAVKGLSRKDNYTEIQQQIALKNTSNKIVLRSKNETKILAFDEIYFVESKGNYSYFHYEESGKMHCMIMSYPLVEYADVLPQDIFYRTHKSFLVNVRHIRKLAKEDQFVLILKNGSSLPVSRRRHAGLVDFLEQSRK